MPDQGPLEIWIPSIARSLAFLCLQTEEGQKAKGVLEKATLLLKLGLKIDDAAALAGSSVESVRVLQSQARKKGKAHGDTKRGRGKTK